jgi:hypothetical protein
VIDRLVALPPAGERVWYFPGAADHGHADLIAGVARRDGTTWIACFEGADPYAGHDGIFALPCGERVFIAGGIADRDDPASWAALPLAAPRATWSPDRRTVVLHDGMSVHVFGRTGPLWSATLGFDAAVTAVTEDTVVCNVYDWALGQAVTRRFDLDSGQPR